MLESSSEVNKKNGIVFVYNRYEKIWRWIVSHQDSARALTGTIDLLSSITYEWYRAVDSLQAEDVEDILKWNMFTDNILRVSAWIGYENNSRMNQEQVALNSIARTFGGYIKRQKNKCNLVESRRWENFIGETLDIGEHNIPKKSLLFFQNAKALVQFNFIKNLMLEHQIHVVKNGFILDGMRKMYGITNQAELIQILMIHIFMYYISFRETEECVDREVKDDIRTVLLDRETVISYSNLVYKCEAFLDSELEMQLEKNLQLHELFPKYSRSKSMFMEYVVRHYFLFFILYLAHENYDNSIINKAIDIQIYESYLRDDEQKNLNILFLELIQIFSIKGDDKKNQIIVNEMLANFLGVMKVKYKEYRKNEKEKNQKEFDSNNAKVEMILETNKFIKCKFQELFSGILSENEEWQIQEKVRIYSYVDYTEYLRDKRSQTLIITGLANFVQWLCIELKRRGFIDEFELSDKFVNDEAFESYLESSGFNILMGSSYVFSLQNRREWKNRLDFLDDFEKRFIRMPKPLGLAIKENALTIKLDEVETVVYAPELEQLGIKKNQETGMYPYSQSGVTLDFDEQELREFIENEKKVVDIYLKVSIAVKEENSGVIIGRKIK